MSSELRFLTLRAHGDEVSRLHSLLLELGSSVAPDELTGAFFGTTTRIAVAEFQGRRRLPVTGSFDDVADRLMQQEVATRPKRGRIVGLVRHPNGEPGRRLLVRAFDRDLRREEPLGDAETDADGFYQIAYSREQFARAEKGAADLVLRVFRGTDALYDTPAAAIIFNVPDLAVVNITLDKGDTDAPNEYDRIRQVLAPLLEGVAPHELREDAESRDITFLGGETGLPAHKLAHFALAHRLSVTYGLVPEFFYALFAENTLIRAGYQGTVGARFDIDLDTEAQPLFYDIVLLPQETIAAAVRQAVEDRFVGRDILRGLDAILERLGQRLSDARRYVSEERPRVLFKHVERFVSAGKHEEVRRILRSDTLGDLPKLFDRLQEAAAFTGREQAAGAAVDASLFELLGDHRRVIARVRESHGIDRPEDLVRLARLDQSEWRDALRAAGSVADGGHGAERPVGGGAIRDELVELHASSLVRKMETRFPTAAFMGRLARDEQAFGDQRGEILALLDAHPDLDLARANIDRLPDARRSPARETLKSIQRVFKVAPRYAQTTALLTRGVRSAASIYRMGETRFVREFAGHSAFTREEARAAYQKAADIHIASGLLAGQIQTATGAAKVSALMEGAPAAKVAKLEAVAKDFPNMQSLFQLDDYCACEECRSVHSAAAYVADTLQFLKDRLVVDTTVSTLSVKIAKEVLFERRPDLGDTDLNCENTNTPIPYIDMVCELLEEAVAPDPGFLFNGALASGIVPPALLSALQAQGLPFTAQAVVHDADLSGTRIVRDKKVVCKLSPSGGSWVVRRLRQTHGTAAERAAASEYLNEPAYATLAGAEFAFRLPFDLFHQETRAYFHRFAVSRAALMRALETAAGPQPAEIAAEEIGLSDEERTLIGTADAANQNTYWNTGSTAAADVVKVVDAFVTKTELTFADLGRLLDLQWINPGGAMFIRHLDNSCSLKKKEIRNLDAPALDRFHRFVRLWKKTRWTITAIDRMIRAAAIGGGTLDDACLVQMQQAARVSSTLGLPLDEICNFFEAIPWDGEASRYARVFLNRDANGTVNPDFLPANVLQNEANETSVPGSGKKLSAFKDYFALCLGTTSGDAGLLIDALGPAAILSAANIAVVYAQTLLARKLRLSAAELLILRRLTGIDPLATPGDTLLFVEKVERVRRAGTKPADLQYLLLHEADNLNDRIFRDEAIGAFLLALQQGYQAAFAGNRSPFEPLGSVEENTTALRSLLSRLPGLADADLSRFQTILDDSFQDPLLTPAAFIDEKLSPFVDTVAIKAKQSALPLASAALATAQTALDAARAALDAAITPAQVAAAAAQVAAATAQVDTAAAQFALDQNALIQAMADAVSAYFYAARKRDELEAAVVKTFKMSEEAAPIVLELARLQQPASVGNRTLLDLLTDDVLVDTVNSPATPPAITPAAFDEQYRALRLLHLMAAFQSTLKLPAETIRWMLTNNAALGWLELDDLMYEAGIAPPAFDAWERLQDTLRFVATYPPVDNPADRAKPFSALGLFELSVTSGVTLVQIEDYLARLAGWDPSVVADLDAHFGFTVADFRIPATYLRLDAAATLLRRLGLAVAEAVGLIAPKLTAADAALMRSALKARYEDSEWLDALKGVQDPLREQKRDALVAYLLAVNPSLASSNDLYDFFLIDVEMAPCMPTSRIVQAHATIQLFVMRCLMGLEPRSVANVKQDSGWTQWKWMANFRVWEANRKIFLWPENWIEPELRDDKSELFTAMENTLQQNELTDRAVEDAAVGYLERLDDLAHLDVMACYYQVELRILHVFARTKGGDPAVYYYRQFQHERYWTPWEKVDLDITGDHLLAFDRNSRVTLAWPIFTSEADESSTTPVPNPATDIPAGGKSTEKPRKRWKIQLAVSERSGTKWLPKKVSKEGLYSPATGYFTSDPPAADTYNFFAWTLGPAGQAISCSNIGGSGWVGSFALTGCKGYPEPTQGGSFATDFLPKFKDTQMRALRFAELNQDQTDDLAILTLFSQGTFDPILGATPGNFKVTYPMQLSVIDWIFVFLQIYAGSQQSFLKETRPRFTIPLGTFMPYFYGDFTRTYAIIPGFYERERRDTELRTEKMFSDIADLVEDGVALALEYLQKLQQDPAHDLNALLQQLAADPKYLALLTELAVYQKLRFGLKFRNFYHPLICHLRATLNRMGFPALMQRDVQLVDTGFDFGAVYAPSGLVVQPYPREDLDFDRDGAYAAYNWELFFHAPFEIAVRLSQDGRYAEAQTWFHYIFNPVGATDAPAPQKYWVTKPFFKTTVADYLEQRIDTIMNAIAADPTGATITDLKFAVAEWRAKPFKPHVVARSRPVAYQVALVLRYIQNLVDWADSLFRQFTRESVTQATQLYILADKLLGPKPRIVQPHVAPPPMTYNQLESRLDLFSNALLDLENMIPDLELLPHGGEELPPPPVTVSALYFCIPPNEKMLQMWDVVDDRLFKIRHCRNIDGVESVLALFSPPIDPGALVRAAAAGLDISAFLAGLGAPLPNYRFQVMTQKATELAGQVNALGDALLQALEKRDAEKLARLRSEQEMAVLDSVRLVKLAAIDEAAGTLEGLKKGRKVVEEKRSYYAAQSYMNVWEGTAVTLSGLSLIGEAAIAVGYILSGGLKLIPSFEVGAAGFGGTPEVTATMGGQQIGNSAEMAVQTISSITRALDKAAAMALTQAGYQRRQDEWDYEVRAADKELAQIDQQIATADLHLDMLDKDLKSHDLQIANAKQTDSFLHTKYTKEELYDWMVGQVSSVYFQAYKLAFDVAKKAERCFQHELGTDMTFLRFGYWDSLKKGLMTAEALNHDIKRMEVAYLDMNRREYELTKNISLRQLDPFALVQLKETGKCTFQVPESLFDLDHPGQLMRRNRLVSVSIPCVAGPHTTVSCTLSLTSNRYRKSTAQRQGGATAKDKYEEQAGNDERFVYNVGTIQSIATSTGTSDAGMFDFGSDERYRPFEGTGAVGTWQLEMPARFPQFDYDTISDVILHLRYTAREGGSTFKAMVEDALGELLNEMQVSAKRTGLFQAFDVKHDFPNEWHRLKQANTVPITLQLQQLPFFVQGHTPVLDKVTWMARVSGNPALFVMTVDGAQFNLNRDASLNNLCVGSSNVVTLGTPFTLATASASNVEDLIVVLHFAMTS